jgi:hypothetical protein
MVKIKKGDYKITEGDTQGYITTFSQDCKGNIEVGQTKICTITNNDISNIPPILIVKKHVINDNGGTKKANDFKVVITTGNNITTPVVASETGIPIRINQGSFTVEEKKDRGYSITTSGECSGTIENGAVKTCSITNNDISPKLVVIKKVINDNGGTMSSGDFRMHVTNSNPSSPSFQGEEGRGTTVTVNGGSYNITEDSLPNYSRLPSTDCSGSIQVGETKTCTMTNDDIAPSLIVIKNVINDNGGTKSASDFTVNIKATKPDPMKFTASSGEGTSIKLNAGSYSVDEGSVTGYSKTLSEDCSGTIKIGEKKTCIITNDDLAPVGTLSIVKQVKNDHGGTKQPSDFNLDVTGNNPSPATVTGTDNGTSVRIGTGSYKVTEVADDEYLASFSPECSGTIMGSQSKICTVVNDDRGGTLIIKKHVINKSDGKAIAANFTLRIDGPQQLNPKPSKFVVGNEEGFSTTIALRNEYTVHEVGDNGNGVVKLGNRTYLVTYSADCDSEFLNIETKVCTVTNIDQG